MIEKAGRERQFHFQDAPVSEDPGTQWMVGMWLELGERVLDQVAHIPLEVLNTAPPGSYLVPARVVLHLVGNDLRMLPLLIGAFPGPDYQGVVTATTAADLQTMDTQGHDVRDILKRHLAFRRGLAGLRNLPPGFLDQAIDHPSFATKREALGHMIWHWSFHSGHLGAVTLELGYEYVWRSSLREVTP